MRLGIEDAVQVPSWSRSRHEGQGLAEYTIMLALVAFVCIVALTAFGASVSSLINSATGIF